MLLSNYHCHTQFCDGRADAEEFVKAAMDKQFAKLGFSSHAPVPMDSGWNMKKKIVPEYLKEIQRLKNKYQNEIEILVGMEIDFIPNIMGPTDDYFQNLNMDYSIGSVHYLDYLNDATPWTIDGPVEWFELGLNEIFDGDVKKYYQRFTQVSCEMMQQGGFDIVGHIDKMGQHGCRYSDLNAKWYFNLVSQLLELARDKELIVEINTKSIRNLGFFYPHQMFFKLLKSFDCKLTVNSDTHTPELMDLGYVEAMALLKEYNIKHTYELMDGRWQAVELLKKEC